MNTSEFNAYIAPARLHSQLWRLGLGVLLILFVYAGFLALVMAGLVAYASPLGFLAWLAKLKTLDQPVPTLLMLFTFTGLALGAIIAAPACHLRGPGTLFGPLSDSLRGFFTVLVIAGVFLGALTLLSARFFPAAPNLNPGQWLRYLPWAGVFILVQSSAEELVFRGYLQQQLAARFGARLIWMGLPALLFTAGHWNPELGNALWPVLASTLIFALIAADLVEQTGSLGASIGLHFANNLFAILGVSLQGTVTGLALYVMPVPAPESWDLALMAAGNGLALLILWRILRFALLR